MNKELFVSSTPHETKVGLVEDDLLAEIYLERENEYTLAGSIYKGRVTRVLPGMQSAFVDIGLERDAFLYVSDFMELEEHDDDLTETVPANRDGAGHASSSRRGPRAGPAAHGSRNLVEGSDAGARAKCEADVEAEASSEGQPVAARRIGIRAQNGDSQKPRRVEDGGDAAVAAAGGAMAATAIAAVTRSCPSGAPSEVRDSASGGARPSRPAGIVPFVTQPWSACRDTQPILLPGESISKYQRSRSRLPSHRPLTAAVSESPSETAVLL